VSDDFNCSGVNQSTTLGKCFDSSDGIQSGFETVGLCQAANHTWNLPSEILKTLGNRDTEENCCETITGMCAGNTSVDEPDIECTEDKHTSKGAGVRGRTEEECCHITGHCTGNDLPAEDIDCSSVNRDDGTVVVMEQTPGDITCGTVNGCEEETSNTQDPGCCQPISGKCTGNTESTENVTCNVLNPNSTLKNDADSIVRGNDTQHESNCCEITGRCAGNTDTNETDIVCLSPKTNKGVTVGERDEVECCHIAGYCEGNDDLSENFDDTKCNNLRNPTGNNTQSVLKSTEDQTGIGWERMFANGETELGKALICCHTEGSASNTASVVANEPTTISCAVDEHVVGNACVACAAGTTNPAGDDASGVDTSCTVSTPLTCINYDCSGSVNSLDSGAICSGATCTEDECCTVQRFTNMEGFTNFNELINIDKGNMIIEGLTNDELNAQCDQIRSEILSEIDIPESQFQFSCRLSNTGEDIIYIYDISPLEGEELPEEIVEKVKKGISIPSFKKAKNEEDEEGGNLTKILVVLTVIIFIIALIIMFK